MLAPGDRHGASRKNTIRRSGGERQMKIGVGRLASLLATTVLGAGVAGHSYAQQASGAGQLEEVVVTATRQSETVNRVPLSISAVTQKGLDQQGIQQVADLQRIVPSLQVAPTGGVDQITIRGITSGGSGAATTGVYLDDTTLTKRNQNGSATNNGSPAPILFDLDRIEVLRGPQGTLYGGSSEGGTIRFITPTPSLTRYSAYAKADLSATHYGDPSYDAGLAIGGPIIQDKLGFRVSAYRRWIGGYIDDVNPYNPPAISYKDTNWERQYALRAELLWKPSERSSILLAAYSSGDHQNDVNAWTLPDPETNTQTAARIVANGWTLPRNWGATQNYCTNYTGVAVSVPAPVSCTGPHTSFYPAQVFGPFNIGPYEKVGTAPNDHTPLETFNHVYSATLGYDLDHMSVKAITSLIHDNENTLQFGGTTITQLFGGYGTWLPAYPSFRAAGTFDSHTKRHGLIQEIRFASEANAKPLSWVAGVYYSHVNSFGTYENYDNVTAANTVILGETIAQRFGVPLAPGGSFAHRDQKLLDTEIAAYGEANYFFTAKLKAIVGVRLSRTSFTYHQAFYGPLNNFLIPTVANGGLTDGTVTQDPITPKFGLQYQISDNDLVYVTASKGSRAGGVNSPLPLSVCSPALTALGLQLSDIPAVYGSDTIWSYEGGAKLRLLDNRVQLNTSVFRINWTGLQQTVSLGFSCGPTFVTNVGGARSQGVEIESQAKLFPGFVANFSMSYDDAKFTEDSKGPTPLSGAAPTIVTVKGQPIGAPTWSFNLGGRYDFQLTGVWAGYLRGDWTYVPAYNTTTSAPGTPTYTPDTARNMTTSLVNARIGVTKGGLDVNLFVNNLFESRAGPVSANRTGCSTTGGAACTVFSNYTPLTTINTPRPREIGVQAAYRY